MYHGHFAAGLFIKALCGPSIPSWPIMFGSSILDIIGGLDGLLGLDILQPDITAGPYMYTRFVFIDWDHSLLMMSVWACLFGWIGCHYLAGYSPAASLVGAASSVVHWLFDVLVIAETGLSLYPHGRYHFGLGLYDRFPVGSWVLECALCAVLGGAAWRVSKRRSGADVSRACVLLAVLAMIMSPWTSPLLLVAYVDRWRPLGNWLRLVQAVGFWTAYIVPATVFARLLDEAERNALSEKKVT
ncbi:hypothetical protein H2201_002504 [Coniosporium apollinis]|uniref:EXPERA domain-containing protein n=1 Tax=Coniosporium apollinis TaxID=61459 RepID=A0ABQ9NZA1_9PEZI|nr:hypothetical protein H2201_002504 [Coniosporium apollinis]